MLNDYDQLCGQYKKTDIKPDKLYSTLPTVLSLAGDLCGKVVLDLGCGTGFFTRELARSAKLVYGFDNSREQIENALEDSAENIVFEVLNVFEDPMPEADVVIAPYVFTYAKDVNELKIAFENLFKSLRSSGYAIIVMDDPVGMDLTRFGAKKKLDEAKDGALIQITLFDQGKEICKLNSVYYTRETLDRLLKQAGFSDIQWHDPIISQEGIDKFGSGFWEGYIDNPELMFIVAKK